MSSRELQVQAFWYVHLLPLFDALETNVADLALPSLSPNSGWRSVRSPRRRRRRKRTRERTLEFSRRVCVVLGERSFEPRRDWGRQDGGHARRFGSLERSTGLSQLPSLGSLHLFNVATDIHNSLSQLGGSRDDEYSPLAPHASHVEAVRPSSSSFSLYPPNLEALSYLPTASRCLLRTSVCSSSPFEGPVAART